MDTKCAECARQNVCGRALGEIHGRDDRIVKGEKGVCLARQGEKGVCLARQGEKGVCLALQGEKARA